MRRLTLDEFGQHCCELLGAGGSVRSRAMFGGRGIDVDELFVALLINDQLYLKVDALSSPQFEAADSVPFEYRQGEQWHSMNCFSAPAEAMESPAAMKHWGRQETSEKYYENSREKRPAGRVSQGGTNSWNCASA